MRGVGVRRIRKAITEATGEVITDNSERGCAAIAYRE